ncbi:hypothetical protein BSKO_11189 [Bryopsis sp. KO-2023]|nr:hypothetical protein BSKO_11189 [Bryopsis sp. KO-2023]
MRDEATDALATKDGGAVLRSNVETKCRVNTNGNVVRSVPNDGSAWEGSEGSGPDPAAEGSSLLSSESTVSSSDEGATPRCGACGSDAAALVTAPGPASYIAKDSHSVTFQWEPSQLTERGVKDLAGVDKHFCYVAEIQQVEVPSGRSTPDGTVASSLVDPEAWEAVYTGPECWTQVRKLRTGSHFAVRVLCTLVDKSGSRSDVGSGASDVVMFQTTPTVPSPPQAPLLHRRHSRALKLKWDTPDQTGGADIVEFCLQIRPCPGGMEGLADDEGFTQVFRGPQYYFKVASLEPGVQYTARVRAHNELGESPWSPANSYKTKPRLPREPRGLRGFPAAERTMLLEWLAPIDNGTAIDRFSLEIQNISSKVSQTVYRGGHCSCQVDGLNAGWEYSARVRAENKYGGGAWSDPFKFSPPCVLPGAPRPPVVDGISEGTATLKWGCPTNRGGGKLQGYQVELMPLSWAAIQGSAKLWHIVYDDVAEGCTLSGLSGGSTYRVRVRAATEVGWGPPCEVVEFKTAASAPESPGIPYARSRTATTLSLAWPAPRYHGGAKVEYQLEMRAADRVGGIEECEDEIFAVAYSGALPEAELDNLTPGSVYALRVSASNSAGVSKWSAEGYESTREVIPATPSVPVLEEVTAGSVRIGWGAGVTRLASTIYRVEMINKASLEKAQDQRPAEEGGPAFEAVYSGRNTSCEAVELAPSTEYVLRVRAENRVGHSEWSGHLVVATESFLPRAPEDLSAAEVGCDSVSLKWANSPLDTPSSITSYVVERSQKLGRKKMQWVAQHEIAVPECIVRDLEYATEHRFRVRARNAKGQGPASESLYVTTMPSVPPMMEAPVFNQTGSTGVRVKWNAPRESNGASSIYYRLEAAEADKDFIRVYSGPNLMHRASQLKPGRDYVFRVRAENDTGPGEWSPSAEVTTNLNCPCAPTDIKTFPLLDTATSSTVSVSVLWDQPPAAEGAALAGSFEVEAVQGVLSPKGRGSRNGMIKTVTKDTNCRLNGLHLGTLYSIRVRAIGMQRSGHGKWSEVVPVQVPVEKKRSPPVLAPLEVVTDRVQCNGWSDKMSKKSEATASETTMSETPLSTTTSALGSGTGTALASSRSGKSQSDNDDSAMLIKATRVVPRNTIVRPVPQVRPRPHKKTAGLLRMSKNRYAVASVAVLLFVMLLLNLYH